MNAHPQVTEAVTIPAYAGVLGETKTVTAPAQWHDRILALSPRCLYGEGYSRRVVDTLTDVSDLCRAGYTTVAYDRLVAAETFAAR